jgi:Signal transduction histidine kinase
MWLRLALNLSAVILISACSPTDRKTVDKLNSLSYSYHYRNVDSTAYYAQQALDQSDGYNDGKAEALNNMAFVSLVRMDYHRADQQLAEAISLTDNQVELFIAEVQLMRLCQRRSKNREFYEHRERAYECRKRINEERADLPERMRRRLIYAESELAIVNSTYYYYVGLERQSIESLQDINLDEMRRDTAQYLNYLYNVGAGGIITEGSSEDIFKEEIDFLDRCLGISQRHDYPYFEANAKEALADHLGDLDLAQEALEGFKAFGDVYQIAGAYRTLASCYHAMGDDQRALEHLHHALEDKRINQAPDLVASIREQMSVAYAAVNDKRNSDLNRNSYIDLQEQTRQDRELEARAAMYDQTATQLNWMIGAVVVAILLLLFLLWLFNRLHQREKQNSQYDDLLEQKAEEVNVAQLNVEKNERRHLEQRAKVSLVLSITPLIDRILHEVKKISENSDSSEKSETSERLDYIRELTDNINEQNDVLTQWIQLRQGELSLHIESFPIQPLFEILGRGRTSFHMKGVELEVHPTEAVVKADRVLTLFMLNTLADNARKFTEQGGRVDIAAEEKDDYVELSVTDTGKGMSEEELTHVFDHKTINDKPQGSHGFGLMNCKGIMEKYRKISQIFNVCLLAAESQKGRGSRFYFRLPKGIVRLLFVGYWLLAFTQPLTANSQQQRAKGPLDRAHIFADSAYFSNINGTYARTLEFADSCRKYLNAQYLSQRPKGRLLMHRQGESALLAPEIQWLHDSISTNYQIILDMRNESAVAALALHEWELYAYNNKVYTQLFKELSADNTLADYCRMMQQSQSNKRIAVILLILILLFILPAYYMLYYRHRLYNRFRRESMQQTNLELAEDELRRAELENSNLHVANAVLDNCLSTLKHETMYYPSRIRQLADGGDVQSMSEVADYYRELYGILSEQATRQVERAQLHLKPVALYGVIILGDENMLRYLFELLKGEVTVETKDAQYLLFTVRRDDLHLSDEEAARLFTPQKDHINYLLCRQIVRDHGEATNRRGCGIWAEVADGITYIKLTLPRYGKL